MVSISLFCNDHKTDSEDWEEFFGNSVADIKTLIYTGQVMATGNQAPAMNFYKPSQHQEKLNEYSDDTYTVSDNFVKGVDYTLDNLDKAIQQAPHEARETIAKELCFIENFRQDGHKEVKNKRYWFNPVNLIKVSFFTTLGFIALKLGSSLSPRLNAYSIIKNAGSWAWTSGATTALLTAQLYLGHSGWEGTGSAQPTPFWETWQVFGSTYRTIVAPGGKIDIVLKEINSSYLESSRQRH